MAKEYKSERKQDQQKDELAAHICYSVLKIELLS